VPVVRVQLTELTPVEAPQPPIEHPDLVHRLDDAIGSVGNVR
jgi:hypothetical protein